VAKDQMALAVLHIASRLHKPVPQSVGVVSFDNIVRNVAGTMSHLPLLLDSNWDTFRQPSAVN
jgi:DNA-binding LacI/PurR family transcriptional regulator